MSNIDKYRDDLQKLVKLGIDLTKDLIDRPPDRVGELGRFEIEYQAWYTESRRVIGQLLPERLVEFEHLYQGDVRRPKLTRSTYAIRDWLLHLRAVGSTEANDFGTAAFRFYAQLNILKSAQARFGSSLFDIKQVLQADLFDSELDVARELAKKGFGRAAGAVAGVVLEGHLRQVVESRNIKLSKRKPTINDLNELLKENEVLDTPRWRHIQFLGDIRNLCDHKSGEEPTKDQIDKLIAGVDECTKSIF